MRNISRIIILLLLIFAFSEVGAQRTDGGREVVSPSNVINRVQIRKYPLSTKCLKNANPLPSRPEILKELNIKPIGDDIVNKTNTLELKKRLFDVRYWQSVLMNGSFYCRDDKSGKKLIDNSGFGWLGNYRYLYFEFDKNKENCVVHIFEADDNVMRSRKSYYTMDVEMSKVVILSYDGNGFIITYEWSESGCMGWYIYPSTEEKLNINILNYTSNQRIKNYILPDLLKRELHFPKNIDIAILQPLAPKSIGKVMLLHRKTKRKE